MTSDARGGHDCVEHQWLDDHTCGVCHERDPTRTQDPAVQLAVEATREMVKQGYMIVTGSMLFVLAGSMFSVFRSRLVKDDLEGLRKRVVYKAGLRYLPEADWKRLHEIERALDAEQRLQR